MCERFQLDMAFMVVQKEGNSIFRKDTSLDERYASGKDMAKATWDAIKEFATWQIRKWPEFLRWMVVTSPISATWLEYALARLVYFCDEYRYIFYTSSIFFTWIKHYF